MERAASAAQPTSLSPALQAFESAPANRDDGAIDRILRSGVQDLERPSLDWMKDLLHGGRSCDEVDLWFRLFASLPGRLHGIP